MITLSAIVALVVTGWVYALCRLINRLSTLADRLMRLSIVGYAVLVSTPVIFLLGVLALRHIARGWWYVDVAQLMANPVTRVVCIIGVAIVVIDLVRRPIELAIRQRRVGGAAILAEHTVNRAPLLFASATTLRARLAQLLSRVPGNHIAELHVLQYTVRPLSGRVPCRVRIVHISDLHYTASLPDEVGWRVVRAVNALQPDVIAITGDFVNSWRALPKVRDFVAALRSTHGVFYVCGNHDIWEGEERLHTALQAVNAVHVGGRVVPVPCGAGTLYLAGTNRPWRPDHLLHELAALPQDASCVVLSHHPDNVLWLRRVHPALVLSGHTHGGQVALPGLGPLLVPSVRGSSHAAGFIRYDQTLLYVNYGLGVGFPVRILCPPEVACFDLDSAPEDCYHTTYATSTRKMC